MLYEEFTNLTGMYVSYNHFEQIGLAYSKFHGTKQEFCEAYKKNADGMAEKIADAATLESRKKEINANKEREQINKQITALESEISRLKEALDRELEWKPCYNLFTNVSQTDYENLAAAPNTEPLTNEEVNAYLLNEFGFSPRAIKIITTVPLYEKNRHGEIRAAKVVERPPVYNNSNWNYVRFDTDFKRCEIYNGNLILYGNDSTVFLKHRIKREGVKYELVKKRNSRNL